MECFSDISFCVWGPILDGGSKIDKFVSVMETLEPVRNGTPAPLEARTDGAAVAGGDLLLTGRGFLTGWRESEAKT